MTSSLFTKKSLCRILSKYCTKGCQNGSLESLLFFLGLQVKQKEDEIFISQDKYVCEILKKFFFSSIRTASTPYGNLTMAFDKRKEGKLQTVVANSTTEAEYIAASHCCGQVLWIQNQMLDYGYNFMQTKIHVDNESLKPQGYLINDGYADLVRMLVTLQERIGYSRANDNCKNPANILDAACLEKSDENAEFHQIVDFLSTCSINYALTVSPTIYASYIEQFWNTATSKIINYVKQIHAIVDGKAVVISESFSVK
ncbi:hypothetical protein Tco_1449539 [Tanacetum coccineum]